MPKLIRLYIKHSLIGFGLGAAFLVCLLSFDIAGLRGLITGVDGGYLAALVFVVLNGIVFGSVQFAIVVMSMQDTTPKGGKRFTQPDTLAIDTISARQLHHQNHQR